MLFLTVCAVYDLRRREVPGWLTLPVLAMSLVWRIRQPDDWLAWAMAGGTVVLALLGLLPGGDMQGLTALALFSPLWYLAAWLGAGVVWPVWRVVRHERWMPGYVGFLVGVAVWMIAA